VWVDGGEVKKQLVGVKIVDSFLDSEEEDWYLIRGLHVSCACLGLFVVAVVAAAAAFLVLEVSQVHFDRLHWCGWSGSEGVVAFLYDCVGLLYLNKAYSDGNKIERAEYSSVERHNKVGEKTIE